MYGRNTQLRIGGPVTPVVKRLMIINAVIFILQYAAHQFQPFALSEIFGLSHIGFAQEFKIWQIFTYMFLHGGLFHLLFNLLALWMFAGELEELWGSTRFLKYYLYTGTGAGICIALMNFLLQSRGITIGASGAIYAILLAYGMTWPNREVLLFLVVPVKMKYLVIGYGAIELYATFVSASGQGDNISHIAHLGGLIFGFIIISYQNKKPSPQSSKKSNKSPNQGLLNDGFKKIRLKKKQKEIETRIKAKKIIDELLEKIAKTGMSSLTQEERKRLEWARKHYYPEGNDTLH